MLHIEVIAVGRMKKNSAHLELWEEYSKQLQWPLKLIELEARSTAEEHKQILQKIDNTATLIAMDERGKSYRSRNFAQKLQEYQDNGVQRLQFILGGADGLSNDIRAKAHLLMSFGQQTWPHMMARVMLLEQIYRAQQILKGHPYHRE